MTIDIVKALAWVFIVLQVVSVALAIGGNSKPAIRVLNVIFGCPQIYLLYWIITR